MTSPLNWFIDFDETLASGSMTWVLKDAFPRLIRTHQLPVDPARLHEAVLLAQERASQDTPPDMLLHDLFVAMGWPPSLERELMNDILNNYEPQLFEDALPFLTRLREAGKRAFVVTNNPLSLRSVKALEIDGYMTAIYTPQSYPGTLPKPHRSLWDVIVAADAEVNTGNSVFVGDDPWADGSFSDNCGLTCYIVDRMARFTHLYAEGRYRWVQSLADIPL